MSNQSYIIINKDCVLNGIRTSVDDVKHLSLVNSQGQCFTWTFDPCIPAYVWGMPSHTVTVLPSTAPPPDSATLPERDINSLQTLLFNLLKQLIHEERISTEQAAYVLFRFGLEVTAWFKRGKPYIRLGDIVQHWRDQNLSTPGTVGESSSSTGSPPTGEARSSQDT